MSKTKIPLEVRRNLWFYSHGRCAICNKPLYRDGVTMQKVNLSEYAHIIADSENGPRGDAELSEELSKDPKNLILLCAAHHKLIDDAGGVKKFDIKLLQRIKKEHEDRIERVTGISPDKKSLVVCYAPKIGTRTPVISPSETTDTLFPEKYPIKPEPIRLDAQNIPFDDSKEDYWKILPTILIENFNLYIRDEMKNIPHISLFAIAPQPLLVLLGTFFGDLYNVEVLEKHRTPNTWKWLNEDVLNNFSIIEPTNKSLCPILIFALSGSDIIERVRHQMGDDFSYWILTCEHPHRDMMRTKEQLESFSQMLKSVLEDINRNSKGQPIKIFPAMPLSCAIELGRVRLPKSDNHWEIYDLPEDSKEYKKTITI